VVARRGRWVFGRKQIVPCQAAEVRATAELYLEGKIDQRA
jgi:hypothetical protein